MFIFGVLKFLANPAILVTILSVWVGTSVYHGVTKWIDERKVVRPYVEALIERDRAARFKDELLDAVAKDKEMKDAEAQGLREALEAYERERKPVPGSAGDCVWSGDDLRVLNSGNPRRRN